MAQGGGQGELVGAVNVDYRGTRHALGRTVDSYAIWDLAGGPPIRTFPLTDEGWAQAWLTYQDLEAAAGWAASGAPSAAGYPTAAAPSVMDYPGARYGLGRAGDQYVIWDLEQQTAVRTFPLNDEGWAQAWPAFQELDGLFTPVPTSYWQKGTPIPIRAMRAGQVIGGAFKLYFRYFWKLLPLGALVLVPVYLITGTLTVLTGELVEADTSPFGASGTYDGSTVTWENPLWVDLVNSVVNTTGIWFLSAVVFSILAGAFLGRTVTVGEAFRVGSRRWGPALWVAFLVSLAIHAVFLPAIAVRLVQIADPRSVVLAALFVLMVLALIFPLILVYIRLLFSSVAAVLEGRRGVAALRRSWDLVRGLGWKVFGNLLLALLILAGVFLVAFIILVIFTVAGIAGDAFSGSVSNESFTPFFVGTFLVIGVMSILFYPFVSLVVGLLYFDARVRKERLNEQVLAAEYDAAFRRAVPSPPMPPSEGTPTQGTPPTT
jgi:hypothetical protein